MGDWLTGIVSSSAFSLLLGAILAGLVGYAAEVIREVRHRKSVRQRLGPILHGELIMSSPREDPIFWKPDHAMRVSLPSISQLLAPGILDPVRDESVLMSLISLNQVVDEFNERAALWDQAFASGADQKKLNSLYFTLQSTNWDYQKAHASVLAQLWQIGPPIPLYEEGYTRPTQREKIRDKVDEQRIRGVRNAWIEYEKRRKDPFGYMAGVSSPRATRRTLSLPILSVFIILLVVVIGCVVILNGSV